MATRWSKNVCLKFANRGARVGKIVRLLRAGKFAGHLRPCIPAALNDGVEIGMAELFVPQGLDGAEAGGAVGWVDAEEDADGG